MYRKIMELCKSKGTTINETEKSLGFARGSMFKWDNHRPSIDKLKMVSDFLEVPIEDLLEDEEKEEVV